MANTILVAGGTGNLGRRIIHALLEKGATVHAIVRTGSSQEKINPLEKLGVKIHTANMLNVAEVALACQGVSCVVSALSGLEEVMIDTQKILVDAAIAAGVPRFIPSDFSLDFTRFTAGENRNLDWRRVFHEYLDKRPIAATSIFNGAFTDLLTGPMPLVLFKPRIILYWGNVDHRMTFTTIDDTATFTAHVALDASTPRFLRIAGDQASPGAFRAMASRITGKKFRLFRAGGPALLNLVIRVARKIAPGRQELYPAWQGMQYMRNMTDERSIPIKLDNDRYPGMKWTSLPRWLKANWPHN